MTSTYVATVSPFGGAAPGDGAALARVRYVNDHATYVGVTDVSHEALPGNVNLKWPQCDG